MLPHGFEDARLAGEQPRVEERQQEFRIPFVEVLEVRQFTNLVTDGESQIPQRVEQRFDQALLGSADCAVEDHEQVDVRV